MKGAIIFLIWIILPVQAFSQKKPSYFKAPLNPEYLSYQQSIRKKTDIGSSSGTNITNYTPSPLYLHFKDRNNLSGSLKSTHDFPSHYDLRTLDLVTSVKDQLGGKQGGNCVAFAIIGSIESRLLVSGSGTYDLSEQNAASCYGFEWGFGEGANDKMATAYLSRLNGPVLESQDPYNIAFPICLNIDPVKYIKEAIWLPNDRDIVKKAIMDYGAVVTSNRIKNSTWYPAFNTYYYDGDEHPDHAYLIVGWKDLEITPAGSMGVWIIKNSWGSDWAENGFAYCAFDDTKILSDVTVFPTISEINEFDHLYMYDKLGAISSTGFANYTGYGLAKFETPEEQLLTMVGTYVVAEGSMLEIEIYDDFDGTNLSTRLNNKNNIYVEFPGYCTFDIPTYVNGDFYIQVQYITPGFDFPIPQEHHIDNYANPVIETDVNWISTNSIDWQSCNPDLAKGDTGRNLTIRAYTVNKGSPKALFEADKETTCINSTIKFKFHENEPVSSFFWDFGEGANPATANTKGPHEVTYSSIGRKTVSLTIDGTDTRVRHQYIDIITDIDVVIPWDTIIGSFGPAIELKAFQADTYLWSPADFLDTNQGHTVMFNPNTPGTYSLVVEGRQGTCMDSDSIILILNLPPPNDNVCNAIELDSFPANIDTVTNQYATVEFNEPLPDYGKGMCSIDGWWCAEGGLQHSIWFWFTAESNHVSFDGKGMDNQIALYEAETCEDILNDNFVLINAFDDCPGREDYSFCMEADVEKGKRYFVQIDGSGQEKEGTFSLVYTKWPVNIEHLKIARLIHIYPNPSDGTFNIKLENAGHSTILIQVYNLSGQLVYERTHEQPGIGSEIQLDLSDQATGIYQVRMVQGDWVMHQKIILQ